MEHFGTAVFSRAVSFREYSMDIWRERMSRDGHSLPIRRLTGNGGIIWRILWRQIQIKVRSV